MGLSWYSDKELVTIVLAYEVWGFHLRHQVVCFQCDNSAVVAALQKRLSKRWTCNAFATIPVVFKAFHDFSLQSAGIPGIENCRADQLSCNNMHIFFTFNPQANQLPTTAPLGVCRGSKPNWTYYTFRKLATATMKSYQTRQKRYLAFCT